MICSLWKRSGDGSRGGEKRENGRQREIAEKVLYLNMHHM